MKRIVILLALLFASCELRDVDHSTDSDDKLLFEDVTETNLPISSLGGLSTAAKSADVDNDGDLDLVIANEFHENILLINDGNGKFLDESKERLPRSTHDSEDLAVADFDNDGDFDIVVVSADDRTNEFYLNDGEGYFSDESSRIIVQGTSYAVEAADVDGDGNTDIIIGNYGQNTLLINDGSGNFINETGSRLPTIIDVTMDIEAGDVDGDGDLDLLVGNEDGNRLLINHSNGVFADQSQTRLIYRMAAEETRQADFGDIDSDGDLDIVFANVALYVSGADQVNRLLLNSGLGFYLEVPANQFPEISVNTMDADFVDVNQDGFPDIITADSQQGSVYSEPFRVFINNSNGYFSNMTSTLFPESAIGKGSDVESADFNGDGKPDLYLASNGSVDILLLHK